MNKDRKQLSIIVFLLIFVVMIYYINQMKDYLINRLIIERGVNNSVQLSKLLVKDLTSDSENLFELVNPSSVVDLKENPLFGDISAEKNEILKELDKIQINIYNAKSQKIFSNNIIDVKDNTEIQQERFKFLSNFNASPPSDFSKIHIIDDIYKNIVIGKANLKSDKMLPDMLHIIIPIMFQTHEENQQIAGSIEFFEDIGFCYSIISNGKNILLAVVTSLLIFYIISIFYFSSKAQQIITVQDDLNKELQEAKRKAEEDSEKKSQFLANVSHELRTPLNSIIGFSEIIQSASLGAIGDPKYQEYGKNINISGNHLLSLINDILDFSKADAEKLEVQMVEMDVYKIAVTSMKMIESRAQKAGVNLISKLPEAHVIMVADPKRMKQVLLNLLTNAVKFTPEGGKVELVIEVEGNNLLIKVVDNGIGIKEKDISKVLSVFGQIDSKLSRKYEGTGLGLPLSKKLVELMGGEFKIKSIENMGTTITLKFAYNSGLQT